MYKIKLFYLDSNQTINSLLTIGFFTGTFWLINRNVKKFKEMRKITWEIFENLKNIKQISQKELLHKSTEACFSENKTNDNFDDYIHLKFYDDNINKLIENMKVEDMIYDRIVVTANDPLSVKEVIKQMIDSNANTSLVYDIDDNFVGIFDSMDVVRFILSNHPNNLNISNAVKKSILASSNTKLSEVVKYLKNGMKYIAYENEFQHNIISQGSIIRYVFESIDQSVLSITIGDFKQAIEMISYSENSNAKNAFALMSAYSIMCLPIVNDEKKIVSVISATDSLYAVQNLSSLNWNVLDYLKESRFRSNGLNGRDVDIVISCQMVDNIGDILKLMLEENIHNIFIVNDENKLLNVVTFTDILQICL